MGRATAPRRPGPGGFLPIHETILSTSAWGSGGTHRAGALRPIYVPNEDDEAMRDLVRAREDAVHNRRRARQRVNFFLLRHGRSYPHGKKNWGARHRRWLAAQYFDRVAQRITLEEYVGAADEGDARVNRLTEQIRSLLPPWRWHAVVEALQALRGVSLIVGAPWSPRSVISPDSLRVH